MLQIAEHINEDSSEKTSIARPQETERVEPNQKTKENQEYASTHKVEESDGEIVAKSLNKGHRESQDPSIQEKIPIANLGIDQRNSLNVDSEKGSPLNALQKSRDANSPGPEDPKTDKPAQNFTEQVAKK